MTTNNPVAQAALSDISQGLGALVWWSLTDTKVKPDVMRAILSAEGADASIVPDIEPAAAIKRATREWAQGRGNADRYRAEVVYEDGAVLMVGILLREQVTSAEVRWLQVDRLSFSAKTGAVITAPLEDVGSAFLTSAHDYMHHLDHNWIRPAIVQAGLKDAQACSLRDRGGVFYVPRQSSAKLDVLVRVIGRIGSCHIDVVTVSASTASQAAISRGANEAIHGELGTLLEQISGWRDSSRKVADNAASSVLSQLSELLSRASLYEAALQVSMADLTDAIVLAKRDAEMLIGGGSPLFVSRPNPTLPNTGLVAKVLACIADVGLRVDVEAMKKHDLPFMAVQRGEAAPCLRYKWWLRGPGADAAVAAGFHAKMTGSSETDAVLIFTTFAANVSAEVPANEVPAIAPEPEPETNDDTDGGDDAANLRERLAEKSAVEIHKLYVSATGKLTKLTKAAMIQAIIEASV